MKRAYKYKIKPTYKQQHLLLCHFGCARFIYNWGLDKKINAYKADKTSLSYVDLAKELTMLKKQIEYSWLKDITTETLQQSLRCLDSAYRNFFREKKGFPKFKSKRCSKDCCKFISCVHLDFSVWKIKLPKIGWVKLCKNKEFNQETCKIGTVTVSRDKCGDFWVSVLVEDNIQTPPKTKVAKDDRSTIGIDLGIKDFAILSNGTKCGNPKFLEKCEGRLKRLQKVHSRAMKGSKNRERLRFRIARQHRRIANKRIDFLHKLSTMLIKKYDTICLEDLNVNGMLKNHCLAKHISSVAWNEFIRQLRYKSEWYGKNIIFIGRFEPSSKTCNCCGNVNDNLTLSDRKWVCPKCRTELDRDVNAAINIRNIGLSKVQLK